MPLPTETQILIVGAGPTGMTCAITLISLGFDVTIVDGFPTNRNGSRAAMIHARTLEVMKTLGLAQELMDAGIPSRGGVIRGKKNKLMQIDIGLLRDETEFPVVLLIPQHDLEIILRKKLVAMGVEIARPHMVVGMNEVPPDGGLEVTFDDGSIIRSQYVVGADGSRSTIRHLAGIDFKDPATGTDYDADVPRSSTFPIALADVYLKEPLPTHIPRDSFSFYLNKFYFMIPLRSDNKSDSNNVSFWRIGIAVLPGNPMPPKHPDVAYLQGELTDRFPWESKPQIASVEMSSRYRVRAAVASTYFKKMGQGSVLLVGDAAHVHSPAGGQGVNLGLCDAVALGHSIRAHIDGNEKVDTEGQSCDFLERYADSRRAVAIRVVGMAGGLTTLVNASEGWRRVLRDTMIWIVGKTPFLRRKMAWRLSGLCNRDADDFGY